MPKKNNNNKKAKQAAPAARPRPRPARPAGPSVSLSKCSADYAKSLMEPWSDAAPCLPSGFPLPSLKRKFFARGTGGQGGAAGSTGFIAFAPYLGVSSNNGCVFWTDGAYTGSVVATSGTGVNSGVLNSSYTTAMFGANGLQYRLVTAGIRLRYTGTELNRGGRFIPFEHPNHGSVVGLSASNLLSMQGVQPVRPSSDGKWVTVVSSGPKEEAEMGYATDWSVAPANNTTLVIMCNGGVAPVGGVAQFTFEWEAWANYEITGINLSGQTESHHDPVGASLAANAVNQAQLTHPHSSSPGFKEDVMKGIETFGKHAITSIWNNRDTIMEVGKAAAMLL